VIKSRETKSWIAELTKEGIQTMGRNMEDLLSHFYWLEEGRLEFIEWLLQEGWKFPSECDIIILTCFGRQWAEYAHAVGIIPGGIDYIWSSATGCAVQNMRIAAKTLELETMLNIFPVGELRRAELLAEELGIPQTWVPCSMLCVGYPREKLSGRPLPEMTSLVWNEYWGVSYEN
jgi:nitroreductase